MNENTERDVHASGGPEGAGAHGAPTEDEMIDLAARRLLDEYREAFLELAK